MRMPLLLLTATTSGFMEPSRISRNPNYNRNQGVLASVKRLEDQTYLPRLGQQFKTLNEAQSKSVLSTLMDFSGPYFQRLCHSAQKGFNFAAPDIIVGTHKDFVHGEDINCYLFATGEYLEGNINKKYPGACLPPLTAKSHLDNCDTLKAHIFEEFGEHVRERRHLEQCQTHEIAFTSYVSKSPTQEDAHDFHFTCQQLPNHAFSTHWHKPGALPLAPIDDTSDSLPQKSEIYITTTQDDETALGFIEGVGLIKDVYLSTGVSYDKCHDFCLVTTAERQA